jgi:excisionase family DNA binding protein
VSGAGKDTTQSGTADGWWPSSRAAVDPYVASVPEAAEMLGISKDLAYDLARRGELPGASSWGGAGRSAS